MTEDKLLEDEIMEEMVTDNGQQLQVIDNVLPKHISILPLRQRPVFPGISIPLTFAGKEKIKVLKKAHEEEEGYIGLVLAQDFNEEDYTESELHEVGTLYQIMRIVPIAPNTVQVLGRGVRRFAKEKEVLVKPNIRWQVAYADVPKGKPSPDLKAYMMAISTEIREVLKLNPVFQEQVNMVVGQLNYDSPGQTMDVISNLLSGDSETLQDLLETFDLLERANKLLKLIKEELEVAKIQQRITKQIDEKVSKQQKEFFLREQLKAIRKELGMEKDENESEAEKIEKKLAELELPDEVLKVVEQELNKLKTLNPQAPDFNVTRNYLETISELPWGVFSEDNADIKAARNILDHDHYGLEEVKDRILEFLSTIVKRGKIAGSIICLVGLQALVKPLSESPLPTL
jgi:ATP-dependent Lon protease